MDARIKYSLLLVGIGIIIAFLPFSATDSFLLNSDELLSKSTSEEILLVGRSGSPDGEQGRQHHSVD